MSRSFLGLPRELRDMIYLDYFEPRTFPYADGGRVFRIKSEDRILGLVDRSGPGAKLLRVNKQIHNEAAMTLYTYHKFELGIRARQFITTIGPRNTAFLRHIQVDFSSVGRAVGEGKTFEVRLKTARRLREFIVKSCTGLRHLEILVPSRHRLINRYEKMVVDIDEGLEEISRDLSNLLACQGLLRTTLVMAGISDDLSGYRISRTMLRRVKDLGCDWCRWTIRRIGLPRSRGPVEVEDNYDIEKAIAEYDVRCKVFHAAFGRRPFYPMHPPPLA